MSWRRIALDPTNARQERRLVLDGRPFTLRLYWVGRLSSWFLDLLDANGFVVRAGIRCAANVDLLAQYRADAEMPQGGLVFISMTQDADVGRDALGTRCRLFWVYPLAEA